MNSASNNIFGAAPAAVAPQGVRFFNAGTEGLEEHDTAEAAQAAAQEEIDIYRDEAADGWPEEVDSVCWGVILGKAVERPVKDAPFMAGILGSDMEPVDYVLEPVAAPALEAPAAPSRFDVNELAQLLFDAWAKAEPEHSVTQHPMSYWASFCDMARAALAAAPQAPAKGLPYEPTSDMLIAGRACDPALPVDTVRAIWWAMWRTAPQAPAAPSIAVVTDEKIDAILDSPGSLGMVIADKRERMRMFARRVLDLAAPAAPAVDAKAHDWRENASYGGEICAECGAAKGSRRGNAPCAWPPEPLDVCTDPYNCARCKTHPAHRSDMHHAGISQPRSAAQAKEGGA